MVGARQRDRLVPVRAQPWQHVRRDDLRGGAQLGLARAGVSGAVSSEDLRRLLDGAAQSAPKADAIRAALEQSLHLTFATMFVIALAIAAVGFLVPKVALAPKPASAEPIGKPRLSAE